MKTVIVTGLIGSGKSTVCALLKERGVPVYNADERTKGLYDSSSTLVPRLEKALGCKLRAKDGKLDRKRLSAIIFSDAGAREKLEAIVYPSVLRSFKSWRGRWKDAPFVVLESAIILSKPIFQGIGDAVILVKAPESERLERVMKRDGFPQEHVRARMSAQSIPEERADIVLENNGSVEALSAAVERVFFQENSYLCKLLNNIEKQ